MSATITLVPPGHPHLAVSFTVARIVTWSVDWTGGVPVTVVRFDHNPPARVLGDHAEDIDAAVNATVSKVDEDVELIASLQKRVDELETRVLELEGLEP